MARNKYDVDESLETPFDLRHFKRSLVYLKAHKRKMIAALAFSAAGTLFGLLTPQLTQYALDVSIPEKNVTQLLLICLGVLLCIMADVLMARKRAYMMAEITQQIIYDLRMDIFSHLQKLPFTYYDNRPHGKILVRVVSYVNNVSDMLSNGLVNFVLDLVNIIFIAVFMMITCWQLGLVILAGVPFLVLAFGIIKPKQRRAWQHFSNKNSNLNAYLQESIDGMRLTQIFTRENVNAGIFDNLCEKSRHAFVYAAAVSNIMGTCTETIAQAVTGGIYVVGAVYMAQAVTAGTLFAMANYASRFWQPITSLANLYNTFINTIAYLERVFETIDEPVDIDDAPDAHELPEMRGKVEFCNVTFGYEPGKEVLHNVNFTVEPGQSIALVGPTGAGKSTIVNLISRFYDVQGGAVRIDGHDVREVTLHSLRSQMGIMLQDSFIFTGTIEENVKYGRLDATMQQVQEACHVVHADEFIESLRHGYREEVKERGGLLSQGQKQLIAFARTIISDPKILILDEATSAIDTKTEKYVQEGIAHLLKGRTSFIIAHRLSTIQDCDRIMYISDKNIQEYGTHEELMARHGLYYQLYTAQLTDTKTAEPVVS